MYACKLIIRYNLLNFTMNITSNLKGGDKNKLIDFYNSNDASIEIKTETIRKQDTNILICTYNVHGWININSDISVEDNFTSIINMFENMNADILLLQEVCFNGIPISKKHIIDSFIEIGFVDCYYTENGGCFNAKNKYDNIMIMSKKELLNVEKVVLPKFRFKRNCITFEYDGVRIATVHLEIGDRFHHLEENNPARIKIENKNSNQRITQLEHILSLSSPSFDYLIGDFNFSSNSTEKEFIWMKKHNYQYYGGIENTTPYNRTDMLFKRKDDLLSVVNRYLDVKVNYSDHVPVLYEIILL